ncbi:MAG: dihydroorotase, partial [Propionibacteriaceae bacterium]|nr:dihydroorotase [Propionibacteriaceae bacterium]
LALDTGAHVHVCHISTAETVEVLRWAKARHAPVTAEVTPHHLLLTADRLVTGDTVFKVNPPLRTREDQAQLRQALAEGLIDVVGTDHAPHLPADKAKPFPEAKPGMTGLESALAVVIETMVRPGLLDWDGVAERMSRTPARLGGIASRQGRPLVVGEPATCVLIDPVRRATVDRAASCSLGRNNPYHGLDLPDPVVATFWAGRPTYLSPALRS